MPRAALNALALTLVLCTPAAAQVLDAKAHLLEQIRRGEALQRDELVQDAAARLSRLEANHPEVLLANMRMAARQGHKERLKDLAAQLPNGPYAEQAARLLAVSQEPGYSALRQARLQAMAGRTEEALAALDMIWQGVFPDLTSAYEYWSLKAAQPANRGQALAELQALYQRYPASAALAQTLAQWLFIEQRPEEALAVVEELRQLPDGHAKAGELLFAYLDKQAPARIWLAQWEAFLARYPDSRNYAAARQKRDALKALISNPAWQQGEQAKAMLEREDPNLGRSVAYLKTALAEFSEDASLWGALGTANMRGKNHAGAIQAFNKAIALSEAGDKSKWQSLKELNQHWLWLEQGRAALKQQQPEQAQRLFIKAHHLKPERVGAVLELAELALAQGQTAEAKRWIALALSLEPDSASALWAQYQLLAEQSFERAERYWVQLAPNQQRAIAARRARYVANEYIERGEALAEQQRWSEALSWYLQARRLKSDDPWLLLKIARARIALGHAPQLDQDFAALRQSAQDAQMFYASALYYQAQDQLERAQQVLEEWPQAHWSESMHELWQSLDRRVRLLKAKRLYAQGQTTQAKALLAVSSDLASAQQLAEWAFTEQRFAEAAERFETLYQQTGDIAYAFKRLEARWALGDMAKVRQALLGFSDASQLSAQQLGKLAGMWLELGEPAQSQALYAEAIKQDDADAQLLRDYARLKAAQAPSEALELYAQAMHKAGLVKEGHLTRATHEHSQDQWLEKSLRREVADLYQAHNPTLTVLQNYGWRNDENAEGASDVIDQSLISQLRVPAFSGQLFAHLEKTSLSAGKVEGRERFGLCQLSAGCEAFSVDRQGLLWGLGWENNTWSVDIGRTPQSFTLPTWLGGVSYNGRWNTLGYRLSVSRRAMTNSLLSFAGAEDPISGRKWGAVTANGVSLNLSYDQGGANGVWAKTGLYALKGQGVEDNQRFDLMAGVYHRWLDQSDQRLRSGLNLISQPYAHDSSKLTLGQGGYYSPEYFVALSLPVSYAKRSTDWSWALEGGLSMSWAKTHSQALYPNYDQTLALEHGLPSVSAVESMRVSGKPSSGIGVRLQAVAEQRLSSHFILGSGISWQHSQAYSPSRALVYLRYYFEPWQGPMPFAVEPISSYTERP